VYKSDGDGCLKSILQILLLIVSSSLYTCFPLLPTCYFRCDSVYPYSSTSPIYYPECFLSFSWQFHPGEGRSWKYIEVNSLTYGANAWCSPTKTFEIQHPLNIRYLTECLKNVLKLLMEFIYIFFIFVIKVHIYIVMFAYYFRIMQICTIERIEI